MLANLRAVALGGESPQSLYWTLEVEPFSTFSYSLMRTNILDLCIDDKFVTHRDAIISLYPPLTPKVREFNDM